MYIKEAKVKQQETSLYHVTFYKKYLQNLRYNVKHETCILHLINFAWNSIILQLHIVLEEQGVVFFLYLLDKIC